MQFRKYHIVLFMALILLLVTACGQDAEEDIEGESSEEEITYPELQFEELDLAGLEEDEVLAEYEGGEIARDEFTIYLSIQGFLNPEGSVDPAPINNSEFRKEIIRLLILEKILIPQVESQAWAIGKAEEEWANIQEEYGTDNIEAGLETYGLTEEEINQALINLFLIEGYFREQITESEIEETYQAFSDRLTSADVRHILVKTHERVAGNELEEIREEAEAEQLISDIYDQLLAGEDFAEMAKEHSEDTGSKENGGLMENVNPNSFVPEFKEAVETQELGQFGSPIQTQFGFHIVQVETYHKLSMDEVRDELLLPSITYQKFADYYNFTLPDFVKEIHIE